MFSTLSSASGWRAAALGGALMLTGCAVQPPLYYWGQYPNHVYKELSAQSSLDERIAALEVIRGEAQTRTAALPPGFRGHLGQLYAQAGRDEEARQQWAEEKAAFPESSRFVDFLLRSGKDDRPAAVSEAPAVSVVSSTGVAARPGVSR